MTSNLDKGGEAPTELHRQRRFRTRMGVAVGVFILASFVFSQWGGQMATPWRIVLALLPVLAVVSMVVVMALRIHELDEYQLKLVLPALAVGFAAMIIAAVTLSALSALGFSVPDNGSFLSLLGVVAWAFTTILTGATKN